MEALLPAWGQSAGTCVQDSVELAGATGHRPLQSPSVSRTLVVLTFLQASNPSNISHAVSDVWPFPGLRCPDMSLQRMVMGARPIRTGLHTVWWWWGGTLVGISGIPEDVLDNLKTPTVFLRTWEGFVEFGSHPGPRGYS